MSAAITLEHASSWMRDPDAYDPSARVRTFTLNGRTFLANSLHSDAPEQWPLMIRDAVTRRYITTVTNWARLPQELPAHL
jgi:hypothetical protein